MCYLYQKRKKKGRCWVHPINSARHNHGHFVTLYRPLREKDPVKFFNYLPMSINSFDELVSKVREPLMKRETNMRTAIPPEEMLVITLRYLASECSLQDLHYNFHIGRSTAGEIVRKVCQTIWDTMKEECIPTPTEEAWAGISAGFQDRTNFPNGLGAVDGKHVCIVKPLQSGSLYQNYKHYFSNICICRGRGIWAVNTFAAPIFGDTPDCQETCVQLSPVVGEMLHGMHLRHPEQQMENIP
uniref:DDE Tnp4 domain-containing protein n=1 Tax=Leptobrachium leishanense TaxID=445787 RepID=A0A8C5LWH2_9ANUR